MGRKVMLRTRIWLASKAVRYDVKLLPTAEWDADTCRAVEKDRYDGYGHIGL
ncbi:MAG: hypothetical protein ACYS4W_00445 [Planctomycetota bacterium]